MKDLTHAMRDMNITDSLKTSIFWFGWKFHHDVAFGGLGEDQNISLATERWKINGEWKTPLAVRHIDKLFTSIKTFLDSDWRCSRLFLRHYGEDSG